MSRAQQPFRCGIYNVLMENKYQQMSLLSVQRGLQLGLHRWIFTDSLRPINS